MILWDFATGRKLFTLEPKTDRIWAITFSPDINTVVSGGEDGMIRFWDVASGRELRKLRAHAKEVMSVAFRKDGKLLASGSRDGEVKLWEFPSGKELHAFKGHSGAVSGVVFHPDGKQLATASYDHTVRLWDVGGAGSGGAILDSPSASRFCGRAGASARVGLIDRGALRARGQPPDLAECRGGRAHPIQDELISKRKGQPLSVRRRGCWAAPPRAGTHSRGDGRRAGRRARPAWGRAGPVRPSRHGDCKPAAGPPCQQCGGLRRFPWHDETGRMEWRTNYSCRNRTIYLGRDIRSGGPRNDIKVP